ncbi:MAG: VWA domain-containing protein [Myxococcota bacterium]
MTDLWAVIRTVGHVVGGLGLFLSVLSCSGLLGTPEWGFAAFLLLLVPVLLLPLQPLITGVNRLAVAGLGRFRQKLSWRLPLAFLPGALLLAGSALLVVGLARPMEVERRIERTSDGLDILLAIDTSCSMEATDLSTGRRPVSRLEVAKGVVAEFIAGRDEDRIGVVVFGEEAFTHVPLTLDHATLLDVMEQVQIGVAGARGTAIGTAIAVSARRLEQVDNPERIVILLTDGQNNAGRHAPLEAAEAASALGIRIYTIGVGGRPAGLGGLFVGGGDGLDERTLTAIAEKTGGSFFRATSADSLRRVYDTINQLERSPAEVEEDVEPHDWYRYAVGPGLLLLFLHILLITIGLRRWP